MAQFVSHPTLREFLAGLEARPASRQIGQGLRKLFGTGLLEEQVTVTFSRGYVGSGPGGWYWREWRVEGVRPPVEAEELFPGTVFLRSCRAAELFGTGWQPYLRVHDGAVFEVGF